MMEEVLELAYQADDYLALLIILQIVNIFLTIAMAARRAP